MQSRRHRNGDGRSALGGCLMPALVNELIVWLHGLAATVSGGGLCPSG
jgi:hypothetical protein